MADMGNTDDKYVVVKRVDVTWQAGKTVGRFYVIDILPDATIIRGQDIFAANALFSYSNSILSTIELLEALGTTPPNHLLTVADYFHRRGLHARGLPTHKISD